MPITRPGDEEEDFEPDEAEYSPEADDAGELWCPKCGAVMYADAVRCPKCEEYVTPGARTSTPMPGWMRAIAILIIVLVIAGLLAALFGR